MLWCVVAAKDTDVNSRGPHVVSAWNLVRKPHLRELCSLTDGCQVLWR